MEKLVYGYTVVFEKQADGGYTATVPGLDYITTEGETLDEARDMARDMIEVYLDSLQADGLAIPDSEADHTVVTEKIAVSIVR
jgi:predicted RNase H-like HicB family nuclease